jgi:hypothetical protein
LAFKRFFDKANDYLAANIEFVYRAVSHANELARAWPNAQQV